MFHIVILFAYHVHVRLEYDSFTVFHARSGRLLNQYVSGFINLCLQLMFFSECF